MTRRGFREQYSSDQQHLLSGALLNQRHQRLNARSLGHVIGGYILQKDGQGIVPENPRLALLVVTDDRDECEPDPSPMGHVLAPCPSRGLYLGVLRIFDWGQFKWVDQDMPPQTLDVSAYPEPPALKKGDVVAVYWDRLRGAWVLLGGSGGGTSAVFHGRYEDQFGIDLENFAADPTDSDAEVYLEVLRPFDTEWQTLSRINWHVPYIGTQRNWRDTRAGLAVFEAPHETKFRFRIAGYWNPCSEDIYDRLNLDRFDFLVMAIKRMADVDTYDHAVGDYGQQFPGTLIDPYNKITEYGGSAADSPRWNLLDEGVIVQEYANEDANWLTAVTFQASLRQARSDVLPFGAFDWISSMICDESLQIGEFCEQNFRLPGEIYCRMTISPRTCITCIGAQICSICTGGFQGVGTSAACQWEAVAGDPQITPFVSPASAVFEMSAGDSIQMVQLATNIDDGWTFDFQIIAFRWGDFEVIFNSITVSFLMMGPDPVICIGTGNCMSAVAHANLSANASVRICLRPVQGGLYRVSVNFGQDPSSTIPLTVFGTNIYGYVAAPTAEPHIRINALDTVSGGLRLERGDLWHSTGIVSGLDPSEPLVCRKCIFTGCPDCIDQAISPRFSVTIAGLVINGIEEPEITFVIETAHILFSGGSEAAPGCGGTFWPGERNDTADFIRLEFENHPVFGPRVLVDYRLNQQLFEFVSPIGEFDADCLDVDHVVPRPVSLFDPNYPNPPPGTAHVTSEE